MSELVTDAGAGESPPAGGDAGDKGQQPPAKKVTFTTEQQAELDRIVAERLRRGEEKWKGDTEAQKAAERDTAEKERLEKEKNFQELASKHQRDADTFKARFEEAEAKWKRAEAIFTELVKSREEGLPESIAKLVKDKDVFEQFEIITAYLDAQPATPAAEDKKARKTTPPTPPAQGKGGDYVQEAIERQKKQATAKDPYADMFKR